MLADLTVHSADLTVPNTQNVLRSLSAVQKLRVLEMSCGAPAEHSEHQDTRPGGFVDRGKLPGPRLHQKAGACEPRFRGVDGWLMVENSKFQEFVHVMLG